MSIRCDQAQRAAKPSEARLRLGSDGLFIGGQDDPWRATIADWLAGDAKRITTTRYPDNVYSLRLRFTRRDGKPAVESCTTHDVLRFALMRDGPRYARWDEMRVAEIMRELGWIRLQKMRVPGTREATIRLWVRGVIRTSRWRQLELARQLRPDEHVPAALRL
jgi:hypothetical protein